MQYFDPAEQRRRLHELGFTVDLFEKVLDLAAADVRGCTEFDAPGAPGYLFWSRSNRYLAEELHPEDWKRTSKDNILRMIHPTMSHAITAISASGGVNDLSSPVRSKNPKGPAVARLVEKTGQMAILSEDQIVFGKDLVDIPTWCLLYKRDNGELVAELSLPAKMNGKYIDEWQERIPLSLPDLGDPGTGIALVDDPLDPLGDDDTDVVVEFREG